ncbi:MAG TPA: 2-oxoacid:acceptor oxidoreductase subunit alpha [Candidatus Nanoarchaeia archaeon]|nr:2-oxoacid:acceptor oxidoreductase subunit alpha [Candidatus Nanoarchaeia archaeon]
MIGGKAGYGIMVTGTIFSRCCSRGGLHVFDTTEYPSLIRGGHNTYQARVEEREVNSHIELIDLLVALNKETVDRLKDKITENGGILFDSSETKINREDMRGDIRLYDVPLVRISKEVSGDKVMMNTVSLGATIALADYDLNILNSVIKDTFSDKGKEIVESNIKAAKAGYDHIKSNYKDAFKCRLERISSISSEKRMLLTGNEAIALGAIRAGCKFYAAYPMTPSTPILHYMASHAMAKDIVVKQTEDEIAAIHAAIGASFAGVRAMTATSGGGFCLMTEGLGLAAITETPLVVVMGQRGGPSTGMATRTEQGDLRFVLHASQGEFPRIVMAPGDVDECFHAAAQAFNLADKYQVQVLILTDKHLAESHKTASRFDTDYKIERGLLSDEQLERINDFKRFEMTETGVSPRTIPGQKKGIFRVPSYEHDEHGWNSENPGNRTRMMDKRMRKIDHIIKDIHDPKIYGEKDADITIVSWGSTKGAVLDAMRFLKNDGINANFLHLSYINPFKADFVKRFLGSAKRTIIVEQNSTMQLKGLIREKTGIEIQHTYSKYSGRQMYPHEVYDRVKEVIHG